MGEKKKKKDKGFLEKNIDKMEQILYEKLKDRIETPKNTSESETETQQVGEKQPEVEVTYKATTHIEQAGTINASPKIGITSKPESHPQGSPENEDQSSTSSEDEAVDPSDTSGNIHQENTVNVGATEEMNLGGIQANILNLTLGTNEYSDVSLGGKKQKKKFEDPTIEYSLTQQFLTIKTNEVDNLTFTFWQKRILFIQSPEPEIIDTACQRVVSNLKKEYDLNPRVRQLFFPSLKNNKLSRSNTIDWLFLENAKKIRKKHTSLFVKIHLDQPASIRYFLNFWKRWEKNESEFRKELQKEKVFLVFSLSSKVSAQLRDRKGEGFLNIKSYPFTKLEFFESLLQARLSIREEAEKEIEMLKSQIERGLWGQDEWEIHNELKSLLNESISALLSKIRERQDKDLDEEKTKKWLEEKINQQHHPIHKTLLYVAVFFPPLRLSELIQILDSLLTNEVFERTTETESQKKKKKGKKRKVKIKSKTEKVVALKDWRANVDAYLQECHLEPFMMAEHLEDEPNQTYYHQVFRFNVSFMEQVARDLFIKRPNYVQSRFFKILSSGFFLNPSLSERVVKGIVYVAIEQGKTEPKLFGLNLLKEIEHIINQLDTKIRKKLIALEAEIKSKVYQKGMDLETQLHFLGNAYSTSSEIELQVTKRKTAKDRMSLLISEMENEPALSRMVKRFYKFLEESGKYTFLVELLRSQTFALDSDHLLYIRLMVGNQGYWVRRKAIGYLLDETHKDEQLTLPILRLVRQWNTGNNFPLIYLYIYASVSLVSIAKEFPQFDWNQYTLFLAIYQSESPEEEWKFIFDWLFDPSIKDEQLPSYFYPNGFLRIQHRADLIEDWVFLLKGHFGGKKPGWYKQFWRAFRQSLDRYPQLQQNFIRRWKERRRAYPKLPQVRETKDHALKESIRLRHEVLYSLITKIEK